MLQDHKDLLWKNLQTAIELEHSTIPPYLTAMFTIDQDTNAFAYQVIRSVVMEEMLHMALACNLMNAVGGTPAIDQPAFIPEYPTELDFGGRKFDVGLIKFSEDAIDTFMKIEQPSEEKIGRDRGLKELHRVIRLEENTIGEFYAAIGDQLIQLVEEYGEEAVFSGNPELQLGAENYYGSGGEIVRIIDLKTALFAIEVISEQGEGAGETIWDGDHTNFGQDEEVAHYFRFKEIQKGQLYTEKDDPRDPPSGEKVDVNWKAVRPMINNPKAERFEEGSPAREKADEFNQIYSHFLRVLHLTFNGQPSLMTRAVGMMYQLKYVADALLHIPVKAGRSKGVAGPPFEYVPPIKRQAYDFLIPEALLNMNESLVD